MRASPPCISLTNDPIRKALSKQAWVCMHVVTTQDLYASIQRKSSICIRVTSGTVHYAHLRLAGAAEAAGMRILMSTRPDNIAIILACVAKVLICTMNVIMVDWQLQLPSEMLPISFVPSVGRYFVLPLKGYVVVTWLPKWYMKTITMSMVFNDIAPENALKKCNE